MNLFPRSLVLFLIVATFVVLFLNNYEPVKSSPVVAVPKEESINETNGLVLGVSETSLPKNINKTSNSGFPLNLDVYQKDPLKKIETISPDLTDCIAYVYDVKSQKTLYEKNPHKVSPIASITKLITALTFLDHNPDWEEIYTMRSDDRVEGGRIYLYTGEKIKLSDLFKVSLVGSANTATLALVHSTGMTEGEFVGKMNKKMKDMNLNNTSFADVTGISFDNVSTAEDLAIIVKEVFLRQEIQEVLKLEKHNFVAETGNRKVVYSTNQLLDNFPDNGIDMLGGKTGYTDAAGYCFVGKFLDDNGNELVSVVLGADTQGERFSETDKMVKWSYNSYFWPKPRN